MQVCTNAASAPQASASRLRTVLIVDDDAAMRERLLRVIGRALPRARCLCAASLAQARAELERSGGVDLLLLDVGLPDGTGLELLPWVQAQASRVEAVVVSSLGDDATVLQALRNGAVGYLLKNGSDMEMELSLASIERGGAPIDPIIARRILALMAHPSPAVAARPEAPPGSLSNRETQVLQLVAQGHSNREIADQLHLSLNTIECHAKSIYRKLAVRSRAAAVHLARSHGLID